jgi:hypothetical protein
VANGHILDNAAELSNVKDYAQPNHVYANRGDGVFELVVDAIEAADGEPAEWRVSRGLATADFDGDGDLDAVIVNSNQLAEVYRNEAAAGAWLAVDLLASDAPAVGDATAAARSRRATRDAIGARLEWRRDSFAAPLVRERRAASSYLSQSALAVHFGLGDAVEGTLEVWWPSGRRQRLRRVPANRQLLIAAP